MLSNRLVIRLLCTLLLLGAAFARAEDLVEGRHYERIAPPQPTEAADGKVEVVEVFWYGCPHCYDFEPYVNEWVRNARAEVAFRRVPAIFRRNWVPHARAFYAAEELGVLERLHPAIFEAIHERHQRLLDAEEIGALFEAHGVSRADFDRAWSSFAVEAKVRQAMALTRGYGITGVPTMVIGGKYRSTGSLAGGYPELLKIVDRLVDIELEESAASE